MSNMVSAATNSIQENQLLHLSDEEYVIYRAKTNQKNDLFSCKAWMITAKTLFPRNFSVQLEAYTSQKAANNPKEAARYFSSLFFDFPNEPGLWQEVQEITEALQSGSAGAESQFHRDLFSHLLLEVQHQLLLAMAERTNDMFEHCRLMLVLLSRFPHTIDIHGKKVVDTLLTAEKHSHYQSPVNCFRKLLVVDLLPIILGSKTIDIPPKQLYRLMLKSIEFYLYWLTGGIPASQGIVENDVKPGESWKKLFQVLVAIGWKLDWELSTVFSIEGNRDLMCQSLWAFYRSAPIGTDENPRFHQLIYCATVLLIESLYEYMSRLEPSYFHTANQGVKNEAPSLVLVRVFDYEFGEVKRLHQDDVCQSLPSMTVSRSYPAALAGGLVSSFLTAVSCWELLHQTEELATEFGKLCLHLRTDTWIWLPTFLTDALIYQGMYSDALTKLQSVKPVASAGHQQSLLLKSAGILFSLGNHLAAAEQALHIVATTPDVTSDAPAVPLAPSSAKQQHHLHFATLNGSEIVQHSINVILACLRDRVLRGVGGDLCTGHAIVLLQYDWPNQAGLFEDVVAKIKRQGHFSYQLFAPYVVQVDLLEEFMFLGGEQNGSASEMVLDIFPPSAAQLATQRRMTTRWGDKGAREDFRASMKRQMMRHNENMQQLMIRFMTQERDSILQALQP